jgi:hypothetical protein
MTMDWVALGVVIGAELVTGPVDTAGAAVEGTPGTGVTTGAIGGCVPLETTHSFFMVSQLYPFAQVQDLIPPSLPVASLHFFTEESQMKSEPSHIQVCSAPENISQILLFTHRM